MVSVRDHRREFKSPLFLFMRDQLYFSLNFAYYTFEEALAG